MPTDTALLDGTFELLKFNKTTGLWEKIGGSTSSTTRWSRTTTKGTSRASANGWRRPTAYSLLESFVRAPSGEVRYTQSGSSYYGHGDYTNLFTGSAAPVTTFPSLLRDQAEVDALLACKSQKVNLAVAWAERAKTAQMVGDVASRIARAYRSARRGNLKRAASQLGASWRKSTGNWLELQYGWKPLLSDVYGACEALASANNDPYRWLITAKGVKRRSSFAESSTSPDGFQFLRQDELFDGAFVRLDFMPGNAFVKTVTSLGLTNPLEVQWELVPFSFVVDWMLPIGDWLGTLDATAGLEFVSGSCSLLTRNTRRVVPLGLSPPKDGYNSLKGGRGKFVRLTRTVYGSPPFASFPSMKNPASLGHMANGLSLLAQAFGRGR